LNVEKFTSTVEPLAARAIVSAQDTVFGHASSSAALISSITSNPLIEFLLGIAFFSQLPQCHPKELMHHIPAISSQNYINHETITIEIID